MPSAPRSRPPLDAAAIERMALRYVERYASTRARLAGYLTRKIRERGCDGPMPDIDALVTRFADLGYVDDRAWGDARASAMARRGLGERRVGAALWHAGVRGDDAEQLEQAIRDRAVESALAFARRRRIGPYADQPADADTRRRQVAAMLRAGHSLTLSRRIAQMVPGEDVSPLIGTA